MGQYRLGNRSRQELDGVHPGMVRVVERAIEITEQDFSVFDGIRSDEEQVEYVRTGVSQTLKSKHLRQKDGHGHAVDLVPYINGKLRWELGPIYKIAQAMRQAADELDVQIRWGGCWRTINGTKLEPRMLVADYVARRRGQHRKAFIDGPHFEIIV